MSYNPKSAKDIAFEKERTQFRKELRERENQIQSLIKEKHELAHSLEEKEELLREKQEWIERLLEYTELSEEEMKSRIEKEKLTNEIMQEFHPVLELLERFNFHN